MVATVSLNPRDCLGEDKDGIPKLIKVSVKFSRRIPGAAYQNKQDDEFLWSDIYREAISRVSVSAGGCVNFSMLLSDRKSGSFQLGSSGWMHVRIVEGTIWQTSTLSLREPVTDQKTFPPHKNEASEEAKKGVELKVVCFNLATAARFGIHCEGELTRAAQYLWVFLVKPDTFHLTSPFAFA
ncbi:hypothetical protein TSMEX_011014 [Taenia solium]|eukprot:TsM_000881100 transcript=TsM_000881100 gene=TsM_000881100